MMDSARARTVGSSSTTRTVVGLAFSDFIRPTPMALKTATMGQKRSSNSRSYFTISISPVALMQQKLRHGSSDRLQIGRVDADTGEFIAAELTSKDVDDGSQVGPLLEQIVDPVASFTGDGAYDRDDVYREVCQRHPDAAVIVPPRSGAVPSA